MAFDPDAYLQGGAKAKAKGFDPDAYIEGDKRQGFADQPGPVIAEWYEEEPETGDKPKYLGELPAQVPGHIETSPETGRKEYVEDKGKTRAVFTDQPGAGEGGRVSATSLRRAHKDTERLGKQAFVGGAIQGATFGFGDELAGLASGGIEGYRSERDQNRQAFREAEAGAPGTFAAGRLAGAASTMAVPGIGTAGAGKPLLGLRNVAIGTGMGAVTAAGESQADLTRGELGPFAKDVVTGAAAGGAATAGLGLAGKGLQKVGKWFAGAPERVATQADDDLWNLIAAGAGKKEREAMAGALGSDRGTILEMARSNPAFVEALKKSDRAEAAKIVLAAQPEVEARLGSEVASMEAKSGKTGQKITGEPILKSMEARRDQLRSTPTPENLAEAEKWQRRIDAYREGVFPPAKVPDLKGEALASRLVAHGDSGTRERATANAADFGKVAEKYKLGKDVGDVAGRQKKIEESLETLNGKTSAIYDKASKGSDIYVANVTGKLREWADELRAQPLAARQADAANIDKLARRIAESEAAAGRTTLTPKELRAEITRLQDKAFSGSYSDPSEAKAMGRELAGRLRGVLDDHVAKHASPATLDRLNKLNKEISTLIAFKDSADAEAAKLFSELHKAAPAVTAPETRTGRQTVAGLYRMIQETKDPEAKQLLTDQLYRQIGPDAAKRLQAVEREQGLLGKLGETVSAGAEQKAGDTLRGSRLGKLLHEVHPITAWAAGFEKATADKLNKWAAYAETLRRQGATDAHLTMAGKALGLPIELTNQAIQMIKGPIARATPRVAGGEAGTRAHKSPKNEKKDLHAWKAILQAKKKQMGVAK